MKMKTPWVKPRLILGDATEPNLARNYEKFKFKNTGVLLTPCASYGLTLKYISLFLRFVL